MHPPDPQKHEHWQTQSRQQLDESLESLDAATLQQLQQVRRAALKNGRRKPLVWMSAAAAVLVAVVSFPLLQTVKTPVQSGELVQLLDEMELLENMEMLAALEELADEV